MASNLVESNFAFQRTINFSVGESVLVDKNYRVTLSGFTTQMANVVNVTDRTNHNSRQTYEIGDPIENYVWNSFEISSLAATGSVVLNFNVDYYGFEGMFTIPIQVKVTVREFPTTLLVTNFSGQLLDETSTIDIYNQYGGLGGTSAIGEYIKATVNNSFTGLTYSIFAENASNLIAKNSTGSSLDLSVAKFSNGQAVYLTHNYVDTMPDNATITFRFEYTLAPSSDTTNYEVYVLETTVNLNFKIGVSNIDNLPATMLINVVNNTLITLNGTTSDIILFPTVNETLEVEEIVKEISIVSFNNVLVANIANFSLDAWDNEYYHLEINTTDKTIIIVPNDQGKSAKFILRITTFNGLMKEREITLFAPLVYTNNLQPIVEIGEINGT